MFRHCLVLCLAALALARPETYKENEEFNYARSSTNEGSKSGFYAAQRGNVGGNFEKAHNMDEVAQGQMSDIVNQVGVQVRDVADSKQGDVYGSAYSKGIYGQRHFDTSNLAGRNFHENVHAGSSASQASGSRYQHDYGTSSSHNAGSLGTAASRYQHGYGATAANLNAGSSGTFGSSQTAEAGTFGTGSSSAYGSSRSSGYQASNHHSSSAYDQNQSNLGVDSSYRVVPVRIAVRPLQPVNLGIQAGRLDQSVDSTFVHNDQESRVHSTNGLAQNTDRLYTAGVKTGGHDNAKHYESSYNYHKEWEKHSEVTPLPLSIPTVDVETTDSSHNQAFRQNQYRQSHNSNAASNIETFNTQHAAQSHQADFNANGYHSGYQRVAEPIANRYVVMSPTPEFVITGTKHGSSHSSGYNAGSRSESHSAYGDQSLVKGHLNTNNDNLLSSGRNHDALLAVGVEGNSGGAIGTGPKKYESSYSYHKSWEKQGDPYVIVPASGPLAGHSENLEAYSNRGYDTKSGRYSAHRSHGAQDDCDEQQRYKRSATYGPRMQTESETDMKPEYNFGSPAEFFGHPEDLAQKTVEFDQQTEYLGQEHQQSENFEQQTQEFGQQSEQLGQEVENLSQINGQPNQRGWQYVESNHPVPRRAYQRHWSHSDSFAGQQSQEQI